MALSLHRSRAGCHVASSSFSMSWAARWPSTLPSLSPSRLTAYVGTNFVLPWLQHQGPSNASHRRTRSSPPTRPGDNERRSLPTSPTSFCFLLKGLCPTTQHTSQIWRTTARAPRWTRGGRMAGWEYEAASDMLPSLPAGAQPSTCQTTHDFYHYTALAVSHLPKTKTQVAGG